MSKIFDLINELCPQGVEFREIEEIFIMKNGYTPSKANKDFWENGTIPWFRMEDIRENGRILSDSIRKITPQAVKCGKLIPKNSIIVATTATIGEHALAIADSFLMNQQFTSFTIRELLKDKLDVKFVFYYFFKICEWCKQNTNSSSFPSVDMPRLKKVKFPVPPLEVQREIVRILDCFTLLTAELTAELTARKKQYEFYRDRLLSFDELNKNGGYELKTLRSIADYSSDRIKFDSLNELNYVGVENLLQDKAGKVSSKYVPASGNCTKFESGDILVGNIRPYLKKIWQADCTGGASGDVLVLRLNDESVDSRYLYQILADDKFFDYNMKNAKGAKMPRGNKNAILEYKIPVPSLPTQRKIVEILDKFDTLVNSITEGLPCEIELRQKQYEYYRERLLSFTEIKKEI